MEVSADEKNMEQPQPPSRRQKGGLITMPFIIANEALEKVASYGLLPNMILYLMGDYHIGISQGTNILNYWSSATNFLPLVGAFVSDSYLGRFLTIGLGSCFSLLGMVLLWLTAMIPQSKPPHCNPLQESCNPLPPTGSQYAFLLLSFVTMSIGAGGIRSSSLAFGADQVDQKNNPNNERVLETFFSWYYAAAGVAVMVAFLGIVYIQDHAGWKVGFGVPAILMFLSALAFFLASPLYIKRKANTSLFTNFVRVIVVSIKNRKLKFPPECLNGVYHSEKGATLSEPTNKLRFLNKACIIRNPEVDITPEGVASNPWCLCTVEQVEELKALMRVLPLWSSAIMMSINVSQGTFQLLQARSMNRHITSGFQFSAGSFGMFTIAGAVIWITLYDRVIIPLASKVKGKPVHINVKLRMGLGLFCSFLAMVVAAIVEHVRRRKAIESGFLHNPRGILHMSAFWLVPQHFLNGVAEAFSAIGQNEFFYTELPKSMSSIAVSLSGLGLAVGSLLATFILDTVDSPTRSGGRDGWISNNINKGHYESYYWLLAIMSAVNLLYFLICSWAYGPVAYRGLSKGNDERTDLKGEELHKLGNGVSNGEDKSKEGEV